MSYETAMWLCNVGMFFFLLLEIGEKLTEMSNDIVHLLCVFMKIANVWILNYFFFYQTWVTCINAYTLIPIDSDTSAYSL